MYRNVSVMNADAEFDPGIGFLMSVARGDRALNFGGGLHRLGDAGKLREDAVAERFDDAAGPGADDRVYDVISQVLEALQRAVFVAADELRKARDVGHEDHCQSAADIFRWSSKPLKTRLKAASGIQTTAPGHLMEPDLEHESSNARRANASARSGSRARYAVRLRCSTSASASGAVTFGLWLASRSKYVQPGLPFVAGTNWAKGFLSA